MGDGDQPDDSADFLRFARARDAAALERLLARHADRAFAQAHRYLGRAADAEDAVQEAYLQLLRGASRYDGAVPFAAWLGRLVHLACLRVQRARRRRREVPMASSPDVPPAAGPEVPAEALRTALASLPERYRAPLALHHLGGLDYAAAAAALGLTMSAFGVRLHRGRELLRQRLARSGVTAGAPAVVAALSSLSAPATPASVSAVGATLAQAAAAGALPATTIPLSLTATGVALMATHPFATLAIVAAVVAASAAPFAIHAADAPPAPAPAPAVAPAPAAKAGAGQVDMTLALLKRTQAVDGGWDAADPAAAELADGQRDAPLRTTSLAVLCYLGAGYDQMTPNKYKATVQGGLRWLVAHQQADGGFGGSLSDEALATTTLSEAYAMTSDPGLKGPATLAATALLSRRRLDDRGTPVWTISVDGVEVVDTRVMADCFMAETSALAGQIEVGDVRAPIREWVTLTWNRVNAGQDGLAVDRGRSRFPARCDLAGDRVGDEDAPAAALTLAAFSKLRDQPVLVESLIRSLPDVSGLLPDDRHLATLALFQFDRDQRFADWRRRLTAVVEAEGARDRTPEGGARWPAGGARGGSALAATAFIGLAKQIFYRYRQVGAGRTADGSPQPSIFVKPSMPAARAQ